MKLNLEQAAKNSDLSCQDLLDYIEAGRLHAERKATEGRTEYLIDADELSRFVRQLKTSTLFLQPDMQIDDPLPASGESSSGNLRRVLTAESVAELKIEHKVLSARVETLERLFSEFIEAEREDQTLMLEDTWKIDHRELAVDEAHQQLSDSTDNNSPHDAEAKDAQPAAQMLPDAVMPNALETQVPQLEPSEPQILAEAVNETALDAKITANGEDATFIDETKAVDVADAKDDYKKKLLHWTQKRFCAINWFQQKPTSTTSPRPKHAVMNKPSNSVISTCDWLNTNDALRRPNRQPPRCGID